MLRLLVKRMFKRFILVFLFAEASSKTSLRKKALSGSVPALDTSQSSFEGSSNYCNEGTVIAIVSPGKKWRVHFEATEWFARSKHSVAFKSGDSVRVVGTVDATTLLIEAM